MPRTTKIDFQGGEHEAEYVEVNQSTELWNQYLLEDGSLLKLKTIVTDVVRIVGAYDGEDNPVYVVKSRNLVSVASPEHLKRKV